MPFTPPSTHWRGSDTQESKIARPARMEPGERLAVIAVAVALLAMAMAYWLR